MMFEHDRERERQDIQAAMEAARAPLPLDLSLEQLLEAWRVGMKGINALGGWRSRRGMNDVPNPRVFDYPDGQRLRHRIRKIEERIIIARRGDRPRGPCPICNQPYEYERLGLYRNEAEACRGCASPCAWCGLLHKQGGSSAWYLCIMALAKRVRELESQLKENEWKPLPKP